MKYLVKQKSIDIDARDNQGCTPLILAAVHNNSNSVGILLKGGASVWKCDKQRQNVLHKAAKEGNKDVVEAVRDFCQKDESEGKRTMKALMTLPDFGGNTPLMLALDSVITGDTLECLLDINATLNLGLIERVNHMGETPMHRACRYYI